MNRCDISEDSTAQAINPIVQASYHVFLQSLDGSERV